MNYKYIYDMLVLKCKNREKPNTYTEMHHIVPRCMNGTDDENNLVCFTAKEHFIAHHLLCKIYPHNSKLWFAFNAMIHWNSKNTDERKTIKILSATEYEILRKKRSELISSLMSGRTVSKETREKLSKINKGRKPSADVCKRISESNKKIKHTAAWNKKVSESLKLYKCTPEHAKHISESKKGKHINYNMNSAERFRHQNGADNMQAIKCFADNVLIGCKKEFIVFLSSEIGITHGSRKWRKLMPYLLEHNYSISLNDFKKFAKTILCSKMLG